MSLNDRFLPEAIVNLIDDLNKLPTIGRKSAQRLAFHLLRQDPADVNKLSQSISGIVENIKFCNQCFNLCDENLCKVCRNNNRNHNLICVVEEVLDLIAIENTNEFSGVYHVLHGSLSPLDGVGPNEIKLKELRKRADERSENIEIILATSTSSEGEATAVYISEMFKQNDMVNISRIASGLPVGGNLDYADELTLKRALAGRVGY